MFCPTLCRTVLPLCFSTVLPTFRRLPTLSHLPLTTLWSAFSSFYSSSSTKPPRACPCSTVFSLQSLSNIRLISYSTPVAPPGLPLTVALPITFLNTVLFHHNPATNIPQTLYKPLSVWHRHTAFAARLSSLHLFLF